MTDLELVVDVSRKFEKFLKGRLGAQGDGLGKQAKSIEHRLPVCLFKNLMYVAGVRNKVIHDNGNIHSQDQFKNRCAEIEHDLELLAGLLDAQTDAEEQSTLIKQEANRVAAFDTLMSSATIPSGQSPEPPSRDVQIEKAFILTLRDSFHYTMEIEFQNNSHVREVVLYKRHGEWKRNINWVNVDGQPRHQVLENPEGEWLVTGWHKDGTGDAEVDWRLSDQVTYATSSIPIESLVVEFEAFGERTKVTITARRLPLA